MSSWSSIVKAASRKRLAKSSDKLVALTQWRVRDGERYVDQPSRRAVSHRAPSWSWAAIDGAVFCSGRSSADGDCVESRMLPLSHYMLIILAVKLSRHTSHWKES
ncbi:putative heterokaryon incompatibility protein [Botrytis fragariae]|uniref:Putative heterokaryon incompatibility protein n=1 Tax=Botrytis fragariae TaxID=1964551 RepID=A0A8H6ARG5_9HELO|nr:putative heterokaryon incompatibility protein [Botrytis fragariae]KAF5872226.1 putative heterokaryon incompatibility protein [Botrytis fragariae]